MTTIEWKRLGNTWRTTILDGQVTIFIQQQRWYQPRPTKRIPLSYHWRVTPCEGPVASGSEPSLLDAMFESKKAAAMMLMDAATKET